MNNKSKQLLNALEHSETMLKDAEAGNWDKVIDMETQRSELLKNLFSSSYGKADIVDIDNKIKKIIDINNRLEAVVVNARDNTGNDITSINKGRHAVSLYAQNTL